MPKPDLLLYLHKDVPKLRENILKRGREYESNIKDEYLEKLERGYWDFFKSHQQLTIVVVDSNQLDFVSSEKDYDKITELLQTDFSPGLHRIGIK